VNDELFHAVTQKAVGNFVTPMAVPSDVAVISKDNAFELLEFVDDWTDPAGDRVTVQLRPPWTLPLTIWRLGGNSVEKSNGGIPIAIELWEQHYLGAQLVPTYEDPTDDVIEKANKLLITTTAKLCSPELKQALLAENLHDDGAINLYYVNADKAVTDKPWVGMTCTADPSIVVIGKDAAYFTAAHEIGHALSLGHVTTAQGVGSNNVMIDAGILKLEDATLGQIYRANLNPMSFLNWAGIRSGPTRFCPDLADSWSCPPIDK